MTAPGLDSMTLPNRVEIKPGSYMIPKGGRRHPAVRLDTTDPCNSNQSNRKWQSNCSSTNVKCQPSESSHAYRRGGITHYLSKDLPKDAVGDRADVSVEVLETLHDSRTQKGKMEQRRQNLDRF